MELTPTCSRGPHNVDRRDGDENRLHPPRRISEATADVLRSWDSNAGLARVHEHRRKENTINYAQRSQPAQSHIIRSAR